MRHYNLYRGDRIQVEDYDFTFPDHIFPVAFAILLGLHEDSFRLYLPHQLITEIVANWRFTGHLILSMSETSHRRHNQLMFPNQSDFHPIYVAPGEVWFEMRLMIIETEGLIHRFKNRTGLIPTSIGELRMAISSQSEREGIIYDESAPRLYWLGRTLPPMVEGLYDSDYIISKAVRESLLGEANMLNKQLIDLAYPGLYQSTLDKISLLKEKQESKRPSISST